MTEIRGRFSIAGVGEAPSPRVEDSDHWEMNLLACKQAIQDSGIDKSEIDVVITTGSMVVQRPRHHVVLCEQLGIPRARFTEMAAMGGSAPTSNLRHAIAALQSGLGEVALVVGADNRLTGLGGGGAPETGPSQYHNAEFEVPYGPIMATLYGLLCHRWIHEFGWQPEQLAEVAVAHRYHASLHPGARFRDPITVDDVLSSRPICTPFRLLDCSSFTDGGGAYVVVSAERAKDLPKDPIYVLGTGGSYSYYYFEKWADLVDSPRGIIAGAADEAFEMAGVSREEIDLVGVADMFDAVVPIALESAGFCGRGEGVDFVSGGRIRLGGELPVNTHGGNLSYGNPGMGAQFNHLTEVCKQLWGEAGPRQIEGAKRAYVHNWSGNMSQHGSAVLSTEL
jgi:acetyl-CoA acetyltransferase